MSNRAEIEYRRALKKVTKLVQAEIGELNDPHEIVRKMKAVTGHRTFREYCNAAAKKMASNTYRQGQSTWRQAVLRAPQGRRLYQSIQKELTGPVGSTLYNLIAENSRMISSVPQELAGDLSVKIQEMALQGQRSSTIAKELIGKYPGMMENRMKTIARTEASKATTALTRSRAESLGLDWYIWRTSKDSRVRDSHEVMADVLVRWSDPPSPEALAGEPSYGKYHAGDTFNDRCYPEVIVDLDLVDFPAKVYHNGRIQRMTRAQFEKIAG